MNQESRHPEKHPAKKAKPNILIQHPCDCFYQLLIYALFCAAMTTLMTLSLSAQDQAATTAAAQAAVQAGKQGFPLNTTSNVKGNVSIEAVLIPPKVSQKVFGKTIGNTYAVIELTISNRSSDASLIIHSVFIDYSGWLLSGYATSPSGNGCRQVAGTPESASLNPGNPQQPWQAQTCPNQISSVEYRVVRGQLLDEQPWTYRNWIIRALQATGSIATAFSFTIGSRHAIQAIGAYTGQVIPATETFWPDSTIGQMNRISDLAFQVNKVIPKESSDIVVAFFPIDRFLTPGFRRWFIDSPAIFFAPYAMLLDPKRPKDFLDMVKKVVDDPERVLKTGLQSGRLQDLTSSRCKDPSMNSDAFCQLANVLEAASLNTVRIMVAGTMTVNVDNVPAKIDSIEITATDKKALTSWTTPTTQDLIGVIHGSFLSNGQPVVVNGDQLGITNLTAVTEGSTDKDLHFKMTRTKAISERNLTFKVVKKTATGANVESAAYNYTLQNQAPHINETSQCTATDNKKTLNCTIQGTSLSGVDIQIENAEALGKPTITPKKTSDTELQIEVSFTNPLSQAVTFVAVKGTGSERIESNKWEYKPQ